MTLSQNMRFWILERDGFACQYCGRKAPSVELQIDHIVPESAGGTSDKDNLVTACVDCNSGKAGKRLQERIGNQEIRARLESLRERRLLLCQCAEEAEAILDAKENVVWQLIRHWQDQRGESEEECSRAIYTTLRSLLARHRFDEVLDCVDITLARHWGSSEKTAIRYLYGVVRNRMSLIDDSEE